MADQGRWFKLWCSAPSDDSLLALPPSLRWAWAALGCYIKEHGQKGKVQISESNKVLAAQMGVDQGALFETISRLPHVVLGGSSHDNGMRTVSFCNWNKYQVDSTVYERVKRLRSKKRGEEKRSNPPVPPVGPKAVPCKECQEILSHLNAITGRKYGLVGKGAIYLHVRHKQQGKPSCIQVIDYKWAEWNEDPKMRMHVDLLTLFRPSNFDRYLNQAASSLPLGGPGGFEKGDVE